MRSPADQPGARRLEDLDERMVRAATELQAISDGQLPEQLRIDDDVLNHREWVEAELQETMAERERTLNVVTAIGEIPYEDP